MGDPEVAFNELERELKDIQQTVHKLDTEKQNKVKSSVITGLSVYLLAWTFGFVWWAATITTQMDTVQVNLRQAADDRFRGRDAVREFTLRDQKTSNLERRLTEHIALGREQIKRIDALERTQIRIESQHNSMLGDHDAP